MKFGTIVATLLFLIVLVSLWLMRQLVLIVVAALIFATALNLVARHIQRFHVRRSLAVILAVMTLVGLTVLLFGFLVPPFIEQFNQFVKLFPRILDRLELWVDQITSYIPGNFFDGFALDLNNLFQQAQPVVNNLLETTVSVFSGTLGVLLNVLLLIILTLMFVADPQWYRRCFVRLFPAFYRQRVEHILDRCEVALSGWLVGIIFNMFVIMIASWVGLSLLGVPLALANGLLAGLLTFIPNIGPGLSVIPPMAIALLDNPWKPLAVFLLYVFIQQVESTLLTPYVMAQQVSIPPALTLLAQIFFARVFGFAGLFLALPLTVLLQVWVKSALVEDVLNPWVRRSPD